MAKAIDHTLGEFSSVGCVPMELGILYAAISEVYPKTSTRGLNEADLFSDVTRLSTTCAEILAKMTMEQRLHVWEIAKALAKT